MTVLLIVLPHNVSARSALVMPIAICLTGLIAPSAAANDWWGATGSALLQELIVNLIHISAGVGLIVPWILRIAGLVIKPATQN